MFSVDVTYYASWQLDPVLIGGIVAAVVAYAMATGPLRERIAPGEPYPLRNALFFYGAMILFYLTEGSPLHDMAERYSLLAHMFQHNLVSYAVAPLIIAGTPVWLVQATIAKPKALRRVLRFILSPAPALIIFSLGYSMWHLPRVYDAALQNSALHHFEHLVFLATSIVVWWPLMSRVPELPAASRMAQMAYLFILPIAQFVAFGAITFSEEVMYPTYEMAPPWLFETQVEEQTAAGALMKISGFIAFAFPLVGLFIRWFHEQTGRRLDGTPLPAGALAGSPTGDTK